MMFKKLLAAVPIVCFTASLVWADTQATTPQEDPSSAPDATVERVEPIAKSQFNLPSVTVTEPVSRWGQHRAFNARSAHWGDGLAYESTGIDQTVQWVGAQGKHWTVRIDDVIAVRDLRIATPHDIAMASLSDEQVNDQLGISIGSWP